MVEPMDFGDPDAKNPYKKSFSLQQDSRWQARRAAYRSLPQWKDWEWHVRNQITSASDLDQWIPLSVEERRAIQFSQGRFHFGLTPYWASLMDPESFFCPIRRQAIPLDEEFKTQPFDPGPSAGRQLPLAGGRLVHAYPDRAILKLHSRCVVWCRFCPQRQIEERPQAAFPPLAESDWKEVERYLAQHPQVKEVILSGGEPLLLNDDILRSILRSLRSIPSVKSLRIETRILSVLPQRVTEGLAETLKSFQPLYLVAHVNHPRELTAEFSRASALLLDRGVPMAAQTLLLKDVNDKLQVLSDLFLGLFKLRVRPYRAVQMLPARGTEHFRSAISSGLRLFEHLRSGLPGLAVPEYVVDTPGGKVPLRTESILSRTKKRVLLRNHEGRIFIYPEKNFSFLT